MATSAERIHGKGPAVSLPATSGFARHAAIVLGAAGLLLVVGTLIDLGILWIGQRQPNPQWEFVAVVNSLDALPRLVIAVGLWYVAAAIRPGVSRLEYLLGAALLLVGTAGAVLGGLLATNYFVLARMMPVESLTVFRTTVLKGLLLSGLYTMLIPVAVTGILAGRRKTRSRRG